MKNNYIDFDLMKKVPNKYNLTPAAIKNLKILDWNRLKKIAGENKAMGKPRCFCHMEGIGDDGFGDWDTSLWIGFFETGKIDLHFTTYGGMCKYVFKEFYNFKEIENEYDMKIQSMCLKFINKLIDDKILGAEV